MKWRNVISAAFAAMALSLALSAAARPAEDSKRDAVTPATAASASHNLQDNAARIEGEKRFRANCARCHAAPPKFAPRLMATIVRHMRVRANITDDDRRFILRYMTQ